MVSHTKFAARNNCINLEIEHRAHLGGHAETAAVAHAGSLSGAFGEFGTIGQDKVRHPALFLKFVVFHQFECRDGIHNLITFFLIGDDGVDDLTAGVPIHKERLGAGIRGVETEGNHLDMGIVVDVFYRIGYAGEVECVDGHIDTHMLMAARGNILLKALEGAFATHLVVERLGAIHAHPDAVGMAAGKGALGIGGDGAGEESHALGLVDKVVHCAVAIAPKGRLATLKVNKARTLGIAVFHFLTHLLKGLVGRIGRVGGQGAMLATQIATVGDENDRLQRFATAQEPRTEEPKSRIEEFFH